MRIFLFLFLIITAIPKNVIGQSTPIDTLTLNNVPYVCQDDSFTVTISGILPSPSCTLDSATHIFRNDSLLIYLFYQFPPGIGVLHPFQLQLRFATPQPAYYTIYSKRFENGYASAEGTSYIGVCTTVSGIKQNEKAPEQLKVSPNPTENILNIGLPENSKNIAVELSDLTGKMILNHNFKASEQKQLNLENLKPGIYLLTLQTKKGKTVQKIVKN